MKFYYMRSMTKVKILFVVIFTILINYISLTAYPIVNHFDKDLLQSPRTENILVNMSTASYLYATYVFIIAGLMYADTFIIDNTTGLKNIIDTKMPRKKYVIYTLGYNFIIAGLFAIIPAFINITLWFCVRANVPLVYFNTMNIFNEELFVSIFLYNKFLFYFLHLLKIFLLGGIIASFAIFVDTRFNNRYVGLCLPLIIDSLLQVVTSVFGHWQMETSILNLITNIYRPDYLSFITLSIFIIFPAIYFFKYIGNRDVL